MQEESASKHAFDSIEEKNVLTCGMYTLGQKRGQLGIGKSLDFTVALSVPLHWAPLLVIIYWLVLG